VVVVGEGGDEMSSVEKFFDDEICFEMKKIN
jgi:hypothetical protein